MGSSTGPCRIRVERGIYRQPNGKYAVCCRHAGRLWFRTVGFDLAAARRERLALIAAARRAQAGEPVRGRRRLGVRHGPRHPARSPKRLPPRPRARRRGRRAQRRWLAAASLPRSAPHVREPPDRRPGVGCRPGQPHPRPRPHHDHARHLHASLRGCAPRPRHPNPNGGQPIRWGTRNGDGARRHRGSAPTDPSLSWRSDSAKARAEQRQTVQRWTHSYRDHSRTRRGLSAPVSTPAFSREQASAPCAP
jgi:hypothetical protein